jgi:hypothetical protein
MENFQKNMEPLAIPKNQPDHKLPDLVKSLNSSLTTLAPNKSETTQIITYALLATAVVGIMVYHYIRENESKIEI